MTKEQRAAANAAALAQIGRINRERMARGVCRHCAGAVPCWSLMFGDAEIGKRWSELSATEYKRRRRQMLAAQSRARKDEAR